MNRANPGLLPEEGNAEEFAIESSDAYVACARWTCRRCRGELEAICLYCRRGTVSAEPLENFTVQCLWAIDAALARQLERWPAFRLSSREGIYLNHCLRCGAPQDEAELHEEPGQPFYELALGVADAVMLVPLAGRVCMSGDYSVEV